MEEEWRAINGYEGLYEVSNTGRVRSLGNGCSNNSKEKILKPRNNGQGYLQIWLCKNGKQKLYKVHRLVLMTFAPCYNMKSLQVNHIDENTENNNLTNLEWVTCKENINHGTRNKRVSEKNTNGKCSIPVVQLNLEGKLVKVWESSMDAKRGGYNQSHIIQCCKGKRKTHGGFRWCYLYSYISKIDPRIKKVILFGKEYLV